MTPSHDLLPPSDVFNADHATELTTGFWTPIWASRWWVIGLTLSGALIAFGASLLVPNRYSATAVLAPVDDEASGGLGGASGLVSQFGGLAGLAGINLGGGSGRAKESIATLKSALLIENFIRDENLLPILFEDEWDRAKSNWKATDPDEVPTLWEGSREFRQDVRTVTEDKKTGLITLSVTWTDPVTAARWADQLITRSNQYLRDKKTAESNRNLDYLRGQLEKNTIVEIRQAIFGLIEAELKQVMLANGNDEYAFRVIDPPRVPERKISPKRGLLTVLGAVLGLLAGITIAHYGPQSGRRQG